MDPRNHLSVHERAGLGIAIEFAMVRLLSRSAPCRFSCSRKVDPYSRPIAVDEVGSPLLKLGADFFESPGIGFRSSIFKSLDGFPDYSNRVSQFCLTDPQQISRSGYLSA